MRTQKFELTLLTPAFLGDAHQSGAWRTPPFKALLREWWRIAAAPAHRFDHSRLRENEGHLFGNAWLDSGATKSKIRLTLGAWRPGQLKNWQNDQPVFHPEVGQGGRKVGSQLYLGYGRQHATALKKNAALQAEETNTLSLAWPEGHDAILTHTLQLIDWFGTVGGRSRNGWGSVALGGEALRKDHPLLNAVLRDLDDCLSLDWPHAIGRDDKGPLIWQSRETFADWKAAMHYLAKTKIGFRTHLPFHGGQPHRRAEERHLLAYPVTNHAIAGMNREARLANQLRFKLYRDGEKLRARIYHTPHACPLPVHGIDQAAVWKKIHAWLDNPAHGLERLGGQQ
ncbi:MAG: RAMP superfamily CRISPR-associated protein [Pseudomonadota bacterium]